MKTPAGRLDHWVSVIHALREEECPDPLRYVFTSFYLYYTVSRSHLLFSLLHIFAFRRSITSGGAQRRVYIP